MKMVETTSYAQLKAMGPGPHVLSVYLPLDPGASPHRVQSARLMDMLKDVRDATSRDELQQFEAEAERVLAYVRDESVPPGGATLVVFASEGRDLFAVARLAVRLPGLVRFQRSPYLIPFEAAIENSPLTAVALIDEREARLIVSELNRITSRTRLSDAVPGRQRQGGWSAFRYERDRAHHVEEHVKHVANELGKLYREDGIRRFILAGAPETTSALKAALPEELQNLVAGVTVIETYASDDEVIAKARSVAEAAERDEELKLVREIRDLVGSRGNGSLGWDQTIALLNEGRVHRLALGVNHVGTPDGDSAVLKAWDTGATVEILGAEAQAELGDVGEMAALLRY